MVYCVVLYVSSFKTINSGEFIEVSYTYTHQMNIYSCYIRIYVNTLNPAQIHSNFIFLYASHSGSTFTLVNRCSHYEQLKK